MSGNWWQNLQMRLMPASVAMIAVGSLPLPKSTILLRHFSASFWWQTSPFERPFDRPFPRFRRRWPELWSTISNNTIVKNITKFIVKYIINTNNAIIRLRWNTHWIWVRNTFLYLISLISFLLNTWKALKSFEIYYKSTEISKLRQKNLYHKISSKAFAFDTKMFSL